MDHQLEQPWEVVPGKALGVFVLGMPLADVVSILRPSKRHHLSSEVIFYPKDPVATDIVVHLPRLRLLLTFEPRQQKLKTITIYKFDRLALRYATTPFSWPYRPATFRVIYSVFGPTYPGEAGPAQQYRHNYPGTTFIFDMPAGGGRQTNGKAPALPTELPDGSSPPCRALVIYAGASLNAIAIPPSPVEHYYELVLCDYARSTVTFTGRNRRLSLGMAAQDVLGELGSPDAQYGPRQDQLLIHYGTASTLLDARASRDGSPSQDYFFNYFRLGIDAQFDGDAHVLKRVIFHTNAVAHADFGQYRKCNVELVDDGLSDAPAGDGDPLNLIDRDLRPPITGDMKWADVRRVLGEPYGDPVVSGGHTDASPFGSTLFYGYDALVFEVTEAGHIASITVFAPSKR